jgi:A/G-specific adenine glycosylase
MKKHPESDNSSLNITDCLLSWYQKNARKLPWRETADPYAIWVSEVMLQQTRVETVIPYYQQFLKSFPTVAALATAPEHDVLKAWEGLGYYRRAKLLLKGAKEVVNRFNGQLPADLKALASLPGVGPYMSGSLASIAFNLPVPAVDGNVIRLVTRILAWEEDAGTANSKRMITNWVRRQFPDDNAANFTQALMEIGALICLPRNPRCLECPLFRYCKAAGDRPERFPVKKVSREIPAERRIVLRITWNGKHLLFQRPKKGLMAGFWEYPNLVAQPDEDALALAKHWAKEQLGKIPEIGFNCTMTHVYTHLRWNMEIFDAEWREEIAPREINGGIWCLPAEEKELLRVAFVRRLNANQ